MLTPGPAKKVTVFVGESVKHRSEPLYMAVLNYLFYHRVSGATMTRGAAGFGPAHHLQMAQFLETSLNLPVKIEFVENVERLDEILPKLLDMVGDGLIEIQDTEVLKVGSSPAGQPTLPAVALKGKAKLMRVFVGEDDRWRGKPLYDAIVESLRAHDMAGVTVYRGVLGYGAHRRFHKEKRMSLSSDLPIMLSVVDEASKIHKYLPVLEDMVQEGLVVLSDVDVIKYTHRLAHGVDSKEQSS